MRRGLSLVCSNATSAEEKDITTPAITVRRRDDREAIASHDFCHLRAVGRPTLQQRSILQRLRENTPGPAEPGRSRTPTSLPEFHSCQNDALRPVGCNSACPGPSSICLPSTVQVMTPSSAIDAFLIAIMTLGRRGQFLSGWNSELEYGNATVRLLSYQQKSNGQRSHSNRLLCRIDVCVAD